MPMPLEGYTVLETEAVGPIPVACGLLADLGAEVIRIEAPFSQEESPRPGPARTRPPRFDVTGGHIASRNKRSIALNLKSDGGRQALYRLVEQADVFVEAYRPGVMKRLGADYESLKAINPGLIYCSMTHFGQNGPYRTIPAHDASFLALGGLYRIVGGTMQTVGPRNPDPPKIWRGWLMGDMRAYYHTTIGILAALLAREQTGIGQYLDLALVDGVVAMETPDFDRPGPDSPVREPNESPAWCVYETKDGKYMVTCCFEPWTWVNFCNAIGKPEYAGSPFLSTEEQARIKAEFQAIFKTKTRDQWWAELQNKDFEIAPVLDLDEVPNDPHLKGRDMFVDVPLPDGTTMRQVNVPLKFSETKFNAARRPAPLRGQHTEEILLDLGYSRADIEALAVEGSIGRGLARVP